MLSIQSKPKVSFQEQMFNLLPLNDAQRYEIIREHELKSLYEEEIDEEQWEIKENKNKMKVVLKQLMDNSQKD